MGTDDVKGKIKEAAGEATDDEQLEREGKADQVKGKVKDAGDKLSDAAGKAKDAATDQR